MCLILKFQNRFLPVVRDHSITTWTRWGRRDWVEKFLFLSCSGKKNCRRKWKWGGPKGQNFVHVVVECLLTLCGWCCKAKHHSASQCLLFVFFTYYFPQSKWSLRVLINKGKKDYFWKFLIHATFRIQLSSYQVKKKLTLPANNVKTNQKLCGKTNSFTYAWMGGIKVYKNWRMLIFSTHSKSL